MVLLAGDLAVDWRLCPKSFRILSVWPKANQLNVVFLNPTVDTCLFTEHTFS